MRIFLTYYPILYANFNAFYPNIKSNKGKSEGTYVVPAI